MHLQVEFKLDYNEDLIEKCRRKNYDKREQKQLDDLELLADLQHNGAATCLTDFTRNALVALWFACQKSDDADGKVFVINIADQRTFWEITHKDIEDKSISDILKFKTRESDNDQEAGYPIPGISVASPKFWYWKPAHLNERIPAQHSLFLFGLPSSGELGAEEILIESASKEQIKKELEALHDICEESLFPDFVGFAYTQRSGAPYLTPDPEEYLRRGIEAGQRGQYSESIQDLTKAIELDPDYADTYLFRGLAYDSQGKHDRAIQDLTKAIELDPDYADAYYLRGLAYSGQEKYDCAIQDLTKAIELDPDYADAYHFRGLAYSGQEKYDRAIQDYTKAIELEPDYADAYHGRGDAYDSQGKHDHAIQDYTKAIELEPDHADAYYDRGNAYDSQGKHDHAIQDYTKAIELEPDHADAYYDRGNAYLHLKKWQEAQSDLTAAKNMGVDIVSLFDSYNGSIADFEQKTGITLPEDIAALLTESEN